MIIASIDFETSKKPRHFPWVPGSFPVCLGMVNNQGKRKVWWFTHTELADIPSYPELMQEITVELSRADLIVAHNAKFDLGWLKALGADYWDWRIHCTMVAEYMLRGQFGDYQNKKGRLGLNDVARRYGIEGKKDRVADYWDCGYETDEIPMYILEEYVLQDCQIALTLAQAQRRKIEAVGLKKLVRVHRELLKTLVDIEANGMLLDRKRLNDFNAEYDQKLAKVEKDIAETVELPEGWNIGSNEHISALLYGGTLKMDGVETVERVLKNGTVKTYSRKCTVPFELKGLGFTPPRGAKAKKEGFFKTDADTLAQLKSKDPTAMKVLDLLKEYSFLSKQKSTYFEGLVEKMQEDDRIHPSMNQTITATGRLSSSNPNGQNISRGSTSPVKEAFISRFA